MSDKKIKEQIKDSNVFPVKIYVTYENEEHDCGKFKKVVVHSDDHTFDVKSDIYKLFNLAYQNNTCLTWYSCDIPAEIENITAECDDVDTAAFVPDGAQEPYC